MTVLIYHNPNCSNSRRALEVIRARGIAPVIVEYLKHPLSREELAALAEKMSVPVRDIVRFKEAAATEAGITPDSSTDTLLDALARHPGLLNRPIVVTPKGAKLCRPGDLAATLF